MDDAIAIFRTLEEVWPGVGDDLLQWRADLLVKCDDTPVGREAARAALREGLGIAQQTQQYHRALQLLALVAETQLKDGDVDGWWATTRDRRERALLRQDQQGVEAAMGELLAQSAGRGTPVMAATRAELRTFLAQDVSLIAAGITPDKIADWRAQLDESSSGIAELADRRVVEARREAGVVEALVDATGLARATVSRRLNKAHGSNSLRKVFPELVNAGARRPE
jgi:hypothetical protein